MKLEAGKYYKTRDGRKAFVAAIELPNPFGSKTGYPVTVYYEDDEAVMLSSEGRSHPTKDDNDDLVSEWAEPIRVKGYINLFTNENMEICADALIWDTLEMAKFYIRHKSYVGTLYIDQEVIK